MDVYTLSSIVVTLAVAVAYINHRYINIPTTIAVMSSALLISLSLLLLDYLGVHHLSQTAAHLLAPIHFPHLLLNGMLGFLLFAGGLNVDIKDCKDQQWEIATLAILGTVGSTVLIGYGSYWLLHAIGCPLPWVYCFLFGALISPTDPIAILSIFKSMNAPRSLSIKIEAESLFNDGIGIVLFLSIYQLAFSHQPITLLSVSFLFLQQAVGGTVLGVGLGYITYWLIRPINNHKLEVLVTIGTVTAGYPFAQHLGVSGPLAMVIAGMIIGNRHRKRLALQEHHPSALDTFWELIDELLNAALFFLVGTELLLLHFQTQALIAASIAIFLVLITRYITVSIPMMLFKLKRHYAPYAIHIIVWGGLRGGLALALALSLPKGAERHLLLTMTYAVLLFTIIIQGSAIKPLLTLSKKKQYPIEEAS